MRISIILLAAGEGKRMKGDKIQYKPDGKESMLEKVLNIYNNLTLGNSIELKGILVTNTLQEDFVRQHAKNWVILLNQDYKTGMASSIVMGVEKAIAMKSDAVLLMLADMPYVTCQDVKKVIETYRKPENASKHQKEMIIRPFFENKPGFPVLFASRYYDALMGLKGDVGARKVIKDNLDCLVKIQSENAGCVVDIDYAKNKEKERK